MNHSPPHSIRHQKRWQKFSAACAAQFMNIMGTSIVRIALPANQTTSQLRKLVNKQF